MSWFGAEIEGPMIVTRTVHFAASATIAGALMFRAFVAGRAAPIDRKIRDIARIGFAIAVVSGLVWLWLQAVSMSGLGFGEAITSGALFTVIDETQFGLVSEIRLMIAIALAVCLAFDRIALLRRLALVAAVCLVASIAWTGHAGSTPFKLGYLHLASDALHLTAASVWVGGLVPLALLLAAWRRQDGTSMGLDAVRRFSTLGIASVAALILSGGINAWILVGSFRGLIVTDYGQLLMLKLAVFAAMLAFAAFNRLSLTPRLASLSKDALRGLSRNTWMEIVLGFSIFALVGVLGTLHPAAHLVN
ncbi:MAG TPA: copper homeostasis membrane protein CopD [Bradyrhizobium sp.]|nr:copper homeostasis membrane protein CopD [Bradyrhizobium sp.]